MMKRTVLLIMILVLVSAMFVIEANASVTTSKVWAESDFTYPEGTADGWVPEGWQISGRSGNEPTRNEAIAYVHQDGYVVLCKNTHSGTSAGAVIQKIITGLPSDFTVMYDVYFVNEESTTGANVIMDVALNGYSQMMYGTGNVAVKNEAGVSTTVSTGKPELGVWYTYIFQVRGDRMSVFRKKAEESAFSKVVDNSRMQARATNEIWITATSSDTAMIYVDNVKVFSGTYMSDAEITVSETNISGTMTLATADVEPALSGVADYMDVMPVIAAFDKKGKILDVEFGSGSAWFNENTVNVSMDIDSEVYENLSGGTIELYVCNPGNIMKPLTSAYVMTVE